MTVLFDHVLLAAHDKQHSAEFFARLFGLPEPFEAGFFVAVQLSDGAVINFVQVPPHVEIQGQHVAFVVPDSVFDEILERLTQAKILYWADPRMTQPYQFNTHHGGRGVYFDDPAGHHLEARTIRESAVEV